MAADAKLSLLPTSGEEHAIRATPFMASSAISNRNLLFPIDRWAPRSGRGMDYQKWMISIGRLGKAFGLPEDWIQEKTPVTPHYDSLRDPIALRSGEADRAKLLAVEEIGTLERWLALNTALYFHVQPSLNYEGTFFLRDSEHVEGLSTASGLCSEQDVRHFLFSGLLRGAVSLACLRVSSLLSA